MIEDYFNTKVTRVRWAEDGQGRRFPDFLVPQRNNARLENSSKVIIGREGENIQAQFRVFMISSFDLIEGDELLIGTDTSVDGGGLPIAKSWPVKLLNQQQALDYSYLEMYV